MNLGIIVVYRSGRDKELYRIVSIEGDSVTMLDTFGNTKTTSLSQIREADDIELLTGFRK